MQVLRLEDVRRRPRHVAVGEFDGVHLGHRQVIAGSDTVLTFEPHPRTVLTPELRLPRLTCPEAKARRIAELGVEELVIVHFDRAFSMVSAERFIDSILVERLGATHVSVGSDFRFGHGARGDAALLASDSRFTTRVVDLVRRDGQRVSSTHIRRLLAVGDVESAAGLLGAPFTLCGEIVHGEQRGRTLGFPTANIVPDPTFACPAPGVYAGRVGEHPAAISVGFRPTFGQGLALLVESYLLDFVGDLYGQRLTVEFHHRLRGEERYDSVDELVEQMHADVALTRKLLGSDAA